MSERIEHLQKLLGRRIAVLDGSWGVLIQRDLEAEAHRGERFRDHPRDAGDPDLLNITRPEVVLGIHRDHRGRGRRHRDHEHLHGDHDRGSRTTRLEDAAYEMSVAGARLAREAADEPRPPAWAAGLIGPLNVSLSVSPRVDDPTYRSHTFDQIVDAPRKQIRALSSRAASTCC